MNHDYKSLILENIFSEEEIAQIYDHINSTPEEHKLLVEVFSHTAYFSWLPDNIVETITMRAQEAIGMPVVLRELSFARYEKVRDDLVVQLTPHRDETFREPRVTVDIQLKSNISWPIVVEGKEYTLQDNQALTFAGTHQVHWRTKRVFEDGDFLDMIFCHFSAADYVPNSLGELDLSNQSWENLPEHDRIMSEKVSYWTDIYNES